MRHSDAEPSSSIAWSLAKALPDTPGWVDIRGMLLSGRATVSGGETIDAGFVVRAVSGALAVAGVVGCPPPDAIVRAVDGVTDMTPVIAQRDNAAHVGQALATCQTSRSGKRWTPERAVLHGLTAPPLSSPPDDVPVRLLREDERLDHLPSELGFEIGQVRGTTPVGVAVVEDRPVSFCYPCWVTETLWDVSIDTLEAYRRRGLAARVVQFMIARMQKGGREPVWGAMESNVASLELAAKLGFTPVDDIVVFSRGPWAYVTRGFDEAPGAQGSPA